MGELIQERYQRDAAFLRLVDALNTKTRGDRITAEEVVKWTGFAEWQKFGGRIRTWGRKMGFQLVAVPNDGWRIALAEEHMDRSEQSRRSAFRKEKGALKALVDMPRAELSDSATRRAEFLIPKAAARVQQAAEHDRDIKKELKLTERVPLRQIAGR